MTVHGLCGCARVREGDTDPMCVCVCVCVCVLLCIWSPYTVTALLLRLTVCLHVNLIKKQRKPLNKLHVSSLSPHLSSRYCHHSLFPPIHLLSSMQVYLHVLTPSLPLHTLSDCMLPPCSSPPSFSPFTSPFIYHSLLLFLPPFSLTLPSLPPFLYVSGGSAGSLLSGTCPDIPQLGSQTSQTGNRADRMTKADQREEGRLTARQLLQLDWQAGGEAIKNKNVTGREMSREAALRHPGE